ncbi:MAG TPA: LysM peptidoglycan-binding domain-containing protein [Lacibacter sp.]|nr:LysM peptidoglycan-binding domain-containing protein [Lacibacter sp.]HMO87642.1 LysM peptidoglycan-binding domain-containing protein [Lacibacter sp.]HMP88026.1 LysM peptidoglycan-binding domain-containing protein [Lacibacter sp.]
MKRAAVLIGLLGLHLGLLAQKLPLEVQLDGRNQPYLNHAVGPQENFYSIGRIYNISPRVFAPYNKLELTSGLSIGQVLRIPLQETNFWQSGTRKDNEVVVPVYHTVRSGETMAAVARLFQTDAASLRSWNNLSGEPAAGKKLIIGFLKVDKTLSSLAAQGMQVRQDPPMARQEPVNETKQEPVKETRQEPVKETPPKDQPKPEPKKEPVVPTTTTASYSGNGFFRDEFNRQTNNGRYVQSNATEGASFKSTSGWSDGKYYILVDGAEKGTIVLVKNPANGKSVYAKVLASVQETRPGSKEAFLLSSAAVAQLGISADRFAAELVWSK